MDHIYIELRGRPTECLLFRLFNETIDLKSTYLVVEFCDEEIVSQRFPHLHDPDDGSVNLVLTILEHPFLSRLLLFRALLQLHL